MIEPQTTTASTAHQSAQAVVYLRVSTREQAERDGDPEGYSLPAQRQACYRKAEALQATVLMSSSTEVSQHAPLTALNSSGC